MKPRSKIARRALMFAAAAVVFAITWYAFVSYRFASWPVDPLNDALIELKEVVDGSEYVLAKDGRLFRVSRSGEWYFESQVFDSESMEAAYVEDTGKVYRVSDDGSRYETLRNFREGFEGFDSGITGIRQLLHQERIWGSLTLLTPQTPTVKDYVKLRNRIMSGNADFLDARVEPDSEVSRTGVKSLKFLAPAKRSGMITSKASISSPLVYFRKGDEFWFQASYFCRGSRPLTIMDLECEWIIHHGGIRLYIDAMGYLQVELKALKKPRFKQTVAPPIIFPLDQWVDVTAHFYLEPDDNGTIQVWQDGVLIVDTKGQTLPMSQAIYGSLEVGISAHSFGEETAIMWVDDIQVSDKPIQIFDKDEI